MSVRSQPTPNALADLLFNEPGLVRCLVAPDGAVVRANAECLRSTGLVQEAILGADVLTLFPELRELHARARRGERVEVPPFARHLHDRETWWEGSLAPLPMEEGTGLLLTLRERPPPAWPSRELLNAAIQSANVCIAVMTGPELRFTLVNPAYQQIVPRMPMLGRRFREVFPEAAEAEAEARFLRVLETGETWSMERYHAPTPDDPDALWEGEGVRISAGPGEPAAVAVFARNVTERVRIEQALARSDEALRRAHEQIETTLSSITDGLIVLDREWRYTLVSDRAAQLIGRPREQLLGGCIWELFPHTRGTKFYEGYQRAVETGQPVHFEEYYPAPLNQWFECHCYPSAEGLTVYFHDVSERKRSEEAARQAMERYEQQARLFDGVVSTTPDFVYLFDRQGRFLYANRRLLEVWGVPLADAVGKTCLELGYEQWHHDMHMREIAQVIETKRPIKGEVPFKAPLTGIFGVYEYIFTPVFGADGEVEIIAGTTRDVTERKQAEEALAESERRFRFLADNVPQIVWTARPDGHVDYHNARWYEFTGCERGLEHSAGPTFLHPDDVQPTAAAWTHAVSTGEAFQKEYRFRDHATGEFRWFLGRALPLRDADGRITKWFGTTTEIHMQKEHEEKLAESLRIREDFLAIAGHELKTPLAALLMQVNGLQRAYQLNVPVPRLAERLEKMSKAGRRLENLINQMLDVSRITAGRLRLEPEPFDLESLVRETVDRFTDSAAKAGSAITVETRPTVGVWDRLRLDQVLTNLLANAIKYGNGQPIHVSAEADGNEVVIRVIDQGIGIDPLHQPRIFGRFERAVAVREYGGFGLGLWISRQIVEASGGRIVVESAPGRGSTFTVRLPLQTQEMLLAAQ